MLSVNEPPFVFQRVGGGCVPVSLVRHYHFETLIVEPIPYMFELWLDRTARTLINCHNPANKNYFYLIVTQICYVTDLYVL